MLCYTADALHHSTGSLCNGTHVRRRLRFYFFFFSFFRHYTYRMIWILFPDFISSFFSFYALFSAINNALLVCFRNLILCCLQIRFLVFHFSSLFALTKFNSVPEYSVEIQFYRSFRLLLDNCLCTYEI